MHWLATNAVLLLTVITVVNMADVGADPSPAVSGNVAYLTATGAVLLTVVPAVADFTGTGAVLHTVVPAVADFTGTGAVLLMVLLLLLSQTPLLLVTCYC